MTDYFKSWAREYAVTSLEQMARIEGTNQREIFQYLEVPKILAASPRYASIAGSIILNAALAWFISERIIQRPFFPLPGETGHEIESELGLSRALESEYRKLISEDGET